jgi:hypothetical protein
VGLPVDRSVKLTNCGEQPDVGVAEKLAVTWVFAVFPKTKTLIKNKKHCLVTALVNIGIGNYGING